jgi:CRISPR/Cas system CSM-associated protein Csm3 (group 7 of RAMP superfamily)
MNNKDDERLRKTTIAFLKDFAEQGYENAVECIDWLEKQCKKKHKFNIGDIISNGQAVFRVDNITKNCIGQDCYFLVNIEDEKKGLRYLILTDSQGNHSYFGEITWLCEQVDKSFEKQGDTN